jgi:hypothetical protein
LPVFEENRLRVFDAFLIFGDIVLIFSYNGYL